MATKKAALVWWDVRDALLLSDNQAYVLEAVEECSTWVNPSQIAKKTGLSVKTVKRHLATLVERDFLRVQVVMYRPGIRQKLYSV